jgi:hypothetical protein
LNARSPDLVFEEFGYPLPFRTTGRPAAAAAALIARHALKILKMEAGIIGFLSFFRLHSMSLLINEDFRSRSRHAKKITTGIYLIFRGLFF